MEKEYICKCCKILLIKSQETHTLCVFDQLPVVSWRRAKYKQMYGLKSTKLISAHTFAYISLDAMIPQEDDQTHIEYGFPVIKFV